MKKVHDLSDELLVKIGNFIENQMKQVNIKLCYEVELFSKQNKISDKLSMSIIHSFMINFIANFLVIDREYTPSRYEMYVKHLLIAIENILKDNKEDMH